MSESEAADRLAGAMFGLRSGQPASEIFVVGDAPSARATDLAGRRRALAARVPAFECVLGRDAYVTPLPDWMPASILAPE